MKNYYDPSRRTNFGSKKVKHVHFLQNLELICLERDINSFADEHPEYKILGIKLSPCEDLYVATITYLCDAPGEFDHYEDYVSEEDEED